MATDNRPSIVKEEISQKFAGHFRRKITRFKLLIAILVVLFAAHIFFHTNYSSYTFVTLCTIIAASFWGLHIYGQGKISKLKLSSLFILYVSVVTVLIIFRPSGRRKPLFRNDSVVLPPSSPDAKQHLPQSVIIGVRKAGTGALKTYLRLHPNVAMAGREANFFSLKYHRGFDWYRKRMPYSVDGQITIEKSSNNFHNSKAAERTFMMNSTIKLILVIRELIERAISDLTQRIAIKKNRSSFIELFDNIKTGKNITDFNCIRPSLYYKYMKKWLVFFPLEQIHIVDGDNLMLNPYEEVHKVESFLGLPHNITKERFVFNETRGFYCFKNESMQMECLGKSKGRRHIQVTPDVIRTVRHYFKPLNQQFFRLVKRKFDW